MKTMTTSANTPTAARIAPMMMYVELPPLAVGVDGELTVN
jgi:hypothetical protein